jgi:hypothetical protein
MSPKYPIYIISKGRAESRLTSKALEEMKVPYSIVIEPQEFEEYAKVIDRKKILTLPFSNLGKGSIPARNWVWEHSISRGHDRHWIMDDNIRAFYRLNNNIRIKCLSGKIFNAAEDFVDRYTNVKIAGLQYKMFAPGNQKYPPFIVNTRIYSCILLDNSCTHRWRGRYNEDTDLSIRILKDGDCSILFYAFLCDKSATMSMKGGNTEALYSKTKDFDGRLEMAKSLQRQHPEIVRITRKWGRWQHHVDYSKFRKNPLKKKRGLDLSNSNNEYGLITITKQEEMKDG